MLSKCINPSCHATFQYLGMGKLFVVRAQRRTAKPGAQSTQPSPTHEPRQYFWLCANCSRSLTIQASGFGRVRIARIQSTAKEEDATSIHELKLTDAEAGCDMEDTTKLEALKKELEFVESGGYRTALGWLPPLIFEDSPICPKASHEACPDNRCALMEFVPEDRRQERIPCRHIPFNQQGETLDTLYNTATLTEIEDTLRAWLKNEIAKLEAQQVIRESGAA